MPRPEAHFTTRSILSLESQRTQRKQKNQLLSVSSVVQAFTLLCVKRLQPLCRLKNRKFLKYHLGWRKSITSNFE